MNQEKENRLKLWAGEILESYLDTLAGDNLVEAIAGGLGEKLGLTLLGIYASFFFTFHILCKTTQSMTHIVLSK